ncbi:uncharacterized protein PRCAT00002009001 [Priceomyces carsonii]|uniref:uncharacterized protein n=1 Tax=Priceomyces carsonii TaxID=28549 RepID=UPI002ED8A606|nr:unnamed protein product [Priceomyces carsonii]
MEIDDIPIVNDHVRSQDFRRGDHITSDGDVRIELRKLGEPVTYFGENNADRRERLLKLLREKPHTDFEVAYIEEKDADGQLGLRSDEDTEEEEEEDFYTPGSNELLKARIDILHFSLARASERIRKSKEKSANQDFIKLLKHRRSINLSLLNYELFGTQLIPENTRALAAVRFSKADDSYLACGSWDGQIFILRRENLAVVATLAPGAHQEKASAIDWCVTKNVLVSGGSEGNINLWRIEEDDLHSNLKPIISIKEAHGHRISKCLFHPSENFIASTSFDQTWKLWDVNRPQVPLIEQEGHSREVFGGSFHPDGSLFASGGLDGICRVWDLRSGRSIATLDKHVKGIYSIDWSQNGRHFATASGDCSIKVWDIRKLERGSDEIFSIPSHTNLVSDVRFFSQQRSTPLAKEVTDENDQFPEVLDANGTFLVSSSYDGTAKIWSADNWVQVKTLKGHSDRVMSCDVSADGLSIVSCGWDRSLKLWTFF